MDKAEQKKKVHELVDYMLDTNNKDVIKHYDDMMWELVGRISREVAEDAWDECEYEDENGEPNYECFKDYWNSKQEDK